MVSYSAQKKSTALARARTARAKGLEANVYKKRKGYGISVTRK